MTTRNASSHPIYSKKRVAAAAPRVAAQNPNPAALDAGLVVGLVVVPPTLADGMSEATSEVILDGVNDGKNDGMSEGAMDGNEEVEPVAPLESGFSEPVTGAEDVTGAGIVLIGNEPGPAEVGAAVIGATGEGAMGVEVTPAGALPEIVSERDLPQKPYLESLAIAVIVSVPSGNTIPLTAREKGCSSGWDLSKIRFPKTT